MSSVEDLEAEVERLKKLLISVGNSRAAEDMGRGVDNAEKALKHANETFRGASTEAQRTLDAWQAAIEKQRTALEALLDDPTDANVRAEEVAGNKCAQALAAKDKAKDELEEAEKGLAKAKKDLEAANERDTKFFAMMERVRKLQDVAKKNLNAALKANKDAKPILAKVNKL